MNIKGLEIVGQIVIYNYQNQINAWKKCSHVEHDVCIKDFAWKNYLGQLTGSNRLGGNYLEGNYPGVIIQGTTIQAPIVRVAILMEAIAWGPVIRGQLSSGAIIQGAIDLEPSMIHVYNSL